MMNHTRQSFQVTAQKRIDAQVASYRAFKLEAKLRRELIAAGIVVPKTIASSVAVLIARSK